MTAHEALVAARTRLEDPANWCPDGADDGEGGMCVAVTIGSLLQESGLPDDVIDPIYDEACGAVVQVLGRTPRPHGNGLVVGDWNDDPRTKHEHILPVVDKAIAATAPEPDVSFLADVKPPQVYEVKRGGKAERVA